MFLDAKRPENKLYLFSGPNWVGIHTDTSQSNCGLTFSAEKRMLPDCLTSWPSWDRQGIVSPTPSPVLPRLLRPYLLRPKIHIYFIILETHCQEEMEIFSFMGVALSQSALLGKASRQSFLSNQHQYVSLMKVHHKKQLFIKPLVIILQLFIAHPLDLLLLLPGELLPDGLVHLDDAQRSICIWIDLVIRFLCNTHLIYRVCD